MRNQGFSIKKNNISAIINQNVERLNRSTNLIVAKENENSVLKNPGEELNKFFTVKAKRNSNKNLKSENLKTE
jgi:hypothetical protein